MNKSIMTDQKLTKLELDELKYHLADRITDSFDRQQLLQIAFDMYMDLFNDLPEVEFMDRAKNYWNDSFDEVVDIIKEYANCKFKKPMEERRIPDTE